MFNRYFDESMFCFLTAWKAVLSSLAKIQTALTPEVVNFFLSYNLKRQAVSQIWQGLTFLKKKKKRKGNLGMSALFSCSTVCCLQTGVPLRRQWSSRGNYSKTDFGKANGGWTMKYSWSPGETFKLFALEREWNIPVVLGNIHAEGGPVLSQGYLAEPVQLGISRQCGKHHIFVIW